ncbi:MAG: serine/threonine protein kinase [Planctomycetes bacterium]|nr:serine/threonine protein kinase [Planctomycetota bacterium]
MTDAWQKKYEVFTAAQQVPAEKREALVRRMCAPDELMAGEVMNLLAAYEEAASNNLLCLVEVNPQAGIVTRAPSGEAAAMIGTMLGPYKIQALVGAGGMGDVFLAERVVPFRMRVAIKILRQTVTGASAHLRFVKEQQALADLHHPGIVRLLDAGETSDGRPYFVMEYIDGPTMAQKVGGNPLPAEEAGRLILELAEAIAYAHARNILHRDLKPQNILFDTHGRLRITDFGLAKRLDASPGLTRTGDLLGTPSYMAPEQAEGRLRDIGPTTDLYGLGAIFYYLLTGRPPFVGKNTYETIRQVTETRPVPLRAMFPDLDPQLEEICLKCLEKKPEDRVATATELAGRLRTILGVSFPPATSGSSTTLPVLVEKTEQPGEVGETGARAGLGGAAPSLQKSGLARRPTLPLELTEIDAGDEMEATIRWEACVLCAEATPNRRELTLFWYALDIQVLLAAALLLACSLAGLSEVPSVRPWGLIGGAVALLAAFRWMGGLMRSVSVAVPICAKHPSSWLDQPAFRWIAFALLGLPLVVLVCSGASTESHYRLATDGRGGLILLFLTSFAAMLAFCVVRYFSTVHAAEITAVAVVLQGGAQQGTRLPHNCAEPPGSFAFHPAVTDPLILGVAFFLAWAFYAQGEPADGPASLVPYSFVLAISLFFLLPRFVKDLLGYPAIVTPLIFLGLVFLVLVTGA